MKREEGIPVRCRRCGGTGDIPVISPEAWINPFARPLLEGCPDCNGSGLQADAEAFRAEVAMEEGERRRARK